MADNVISECFRRNMEVALSPRIGHQSFQAGDRKRRSFLRRKLSFTLGVKTWGLFFPQYYGLAGTLNNVRLLRACLRTSRQVDLKGSDAPLDTTSTTGLPTQKIPPTGPRTIGKTHIRAQPEDRNPFPQRVIPLALAEHEAGLEWWRSDRTHSGVKLRLACYGVGVY